MSPPDTKSASAAAALAPVCDAIESGAGLPEVVRAAARALGASLVLIDRSSAVLAVAARSPAEETKLMEAGPGVEVVDLRVGGEVCGQLRVAQREEVASARVRLVALLVASEVERLRAPERASDEAIRGFLFAVLRREVTDRDDLIARGKELGIDLEAGAGVVVARAHPLAPLDDDWRIRVLTVAERGARTASPGTLAALADREDAPGEVVLLVPGSDEAVLRRLVEVVLGELEVTLPGFAFAAGHSRVALDPVDLHRAGHEAQLAANVAEADGARALAFEETGAYRLLLSAMSEDPAELRRFYEDTLEPVVTYDEQYETDLVQTLEAFLESDGNVAGSAQKLFTHRHTVRYRLERVRDLSGHDVSSTDGREKLSLGLKAMRVLGIPARRGPASEAGTAAGRVPRPR